MLKKTTVSEATHAGGLWGGILACAVSGALALAPLAGCATQGQSAALSSAASEGATADGGSASQLGATQAAGEEASHVEYTLYLGTNDKDSNAPVFTPEEAKEHAKAILVKHFGGYTIQEAEGGWVDDTGTLFQEYTLVIHLSDTNLDAVHAASRELIKEFRQSSVLINTNQTETEFYEGE